MPKGKYVRRPRADADLEKLADEAPERTAGHLHRAMDANPAIRDALRERVVLPTEVREMPEPVAPAVPAHDDADIQRVAALLTEPAKPAPPPTFETWADEDEPSIPANDRVTQKVAEWAGSVCRVAHTVTWIPADDGAAMEVLLTTEHGTSRLQAPVAQWTEAGIDDALAVMRAELRV